MSLLIGIKNTTSQTVPALGAINIGSVYRRYCKKNQCGFRTFEADTTSVSIQHQGIYHITITAVGTATAAGDVTIQLLINGEVVPGALATETITTPETEFRTFVIDYYILVDTACLLGRQSTVTKSISFQNTGVGATLTSVVVNVSKEV
jgi:hypothetical protein